MAGLPVSVGAVMDAVGNHKIMPLTAEVFHPHSSGCFSPRAFKVGALQDNPSSPSSEFSWRRKKAHFQRIGSLIKGRHLFIFQAESNDYFL